MPLLPAPCASLGRRAERAIGDAYGDLREDCRELIGGDDLTARSLKQDRIRWNEVIGREMREGGAHGCACLAGHADGLWRRGRMQRLTTLLDIVDQTIERHGELVASHRLVALECSAGRVHQLFRRDAHYRRTSPVVRGNVSQGGGESRNGNARQADHGVDTAPKLRIETLQ